MGQLTLSFVPGLTSRYRTLREATLTAVVNSRGGIAGVAPALDMSPSQLGRKLNGGEDDPHRTFDIDDWVAAIEAAGDLTPIYWLVEKFLPSDDQRREIAMDRLAKLMPDLVEIMSQAGAVKAKGKR